LTLTVISSIFNLFLIIPYSSDSYNCIALTTVTIRCKQTYYKCVKL